MKIGQYSANIIKNVKCQKICADLSRSNMQYFFLSLFRHTVLIHALSSLHSYGTPSQKLEQVRFRTKREKVWISPQFVDIHIHMYAQLFIIQPCNIGNLSNVGNLWWFYPVPPIKVVITSFQKPCDFGNYGNLPEIPLISIMTAGKDIGNVGNLGNYGNLQRSQNFKLGKNIPNLSNYGNVGNLSFQI